MFGSKQHYLLFGSSTLWQPYSSYRHYGLCNLQTGICNYNEIIKRETLYEVVYDGNHGVTFILLAVEYAVGKRVTISAHE